MAQRIVLFSALMFAALIVGGQYVVLWDHNPTGMSAAFYTEKMQHAIRAIGLPLFSVQCGAALLTMVSAFIGRRDRPTVYFLLAASACCLTAVLFTVFGNIPILNQIATWNIGSPPANWNELAERRWWIHSGRFSVQVAGLVLLILPAFYHRGTSA